MDGIDKTLAQIGAIRAPEQLSSMDEAVLLRLSALQGSASLASGRKMSVAAIVAIGIGMASNLAPSAPRQAPLPFGAPTSLAPSSLLAAPE